MRLTRFAKQTCLFVLFISIVSLSVTSCNKNGESVVPSTQNAEAIQRQNTELVKLFAKELNSSSTLKSSEGTLSKISSVEGKELFMKFFKNFKVEVDGQWVSLQDSKSLNMEDLYHAVVDKAYKFENSDVLFAGKLKKSKPTREQIRDAMRKECDSYIWGVASLCNLAVDIAYIVG